MCVMNDFMHSFHRTFSIHINVIEVVEGSGGNVYSKGNLMVLISVITLLVTL